MTAKPPKMFTLASMTARNPRIFGNTPWLNPVASIAPTMITDEIALVTAINGECSAGVTFHTT